MKGQKVTVTGGGGFIGKALVRALLKEGADVAVLGRNEYPELQKLGVTCLQGDIQDQDFLMQAFAGSSTVFHVAAKAGIWGSKEEYFAINTQGTNNVLRACQNNGVPNLVYTSTPSVVFDQQDITGGDESLPYGRNPLCHYAASKIAAERAVLAANSKKLRTLAIRPHLVWGPGDQNLIPRLVERGRSGALKIVGSGQNKVDIAYIDNVVHAHILAAKNLSGDASGAGLAFFIGQKEPVALWEWINELFTRLEIAPVKKKVPFFVAYTAGSLLEFLGKLSKKKEEPKMTRFIANQLAHSHWFSHRKAEKILGYNELVSTEEGMVRLISWLQNC